MSRSRLYLLISVAVCVLVSACGKRAPAPAPDLPTVVIAPEASDTVPPPREVPLAAEPSSAEDALEVFVIRGANGMWKAQYPSGQRVLIGSTEQLTEAEEKQVGKLVLPVNRPVKFTLASEEGTRRFEILRFALSVEASAGRYTAAATKPTRVGEFAIRSGHDRIGTAVVVAANEFDDWLQGFMPLAGANPVDGSLAQKGHQLFLKLQCINCHSGGEKAKAPTLAGLYGSRVALKGGAEIADDHYIIESIRRPRLKVVEGWEAIMPAYDEKQVTAEEMNALVAYIKSLKKGEKAKEERFPPVGAPAERPKETAPPPREKPGISDGLKPTGLRPVAPPPRAK